MKTLISMFKNKEVRNRILFTLGILLVYKLGSAIPTPRIDLVKVTALDSNSILNMLNMLGGGRIQSFSVFALGVGPYITASIIVQLLSMDVIPQLTELSKSGETGKQTLEKITKYLAVVLAFIQSYTMTYAFSVQYGIVIEPSVATYMYVATIMTAGTMFSIWLGDRISAFGIGNGLSLLIFTGIISSLPTTFRQVFTKLVLGDIVSSSTLGMLLFILYLITYVLIMVMVIFMTEATRKIPIQYTSSNVSRGKNDMTFIPLKINSAGVTPVIFASAIMQAPLVVLSFFKTNKVIEFFNLLLDHRQPLGLIIYIVLIIAFTFFYTNLQVDPEKMAENLNKNGSYILGVRPGKDTKNYLSTILNRITVVGALSLAAIALLPNLLVLIFPALPDAVSLGGTGIIIAVGVALETSKDISSKLAQKTYRGLVRK